MLNLFILSLYELAVCVLSFLGSDNSLIHLSFKLILQVLNHPLLLVNDGLLCLQLLFCLFQFSFHLLQPDNFLIALFLLLQKLIAVVEFELGDDLLFVAQTLVKYLLHRQLMSSDSPFVLSVLLSYHLNLLRMGFLQPLKLLLLAAEILSERACLLLQRNYSRLRVSILGLEGRYRCLEFMNGDGELILFRRRACD